MKARLILSLDIDMDKFREDREDPDLTPEDIRAGLAAEIENDLFGGALSSCGALRSYKVLLAGERVGE